MINYDLFLLIYTVILLISVLFSVAAYIFKSIGLHTVAKRRGIDSPWLAFIPYLDLYLLGCISDNYNKLAFNKTTKHGNTLLYTTVASLVASFMVYLPIYSILITAYISYGHSYSVDALLHSYLPAVIVLLVISLLYGIGQLIITIFKYIALYRFYQAATKNNEAIYLVLSIFISALTPFFIFFLRNKDDGMPKPQEELQ